MKELSKIKYGERVFALFEQISHPLGTHDIRRLTGLDKFAVQKVLADLCKSTYIHNTGAGYRRTEHGKKTAS